MSEIDRIITDLEWCDAVVRRYWFEGEKSPSGTYGLSAGVITKLHTAILRLQEQPPTP